MARAGILFGLAAVVAFIAGLFIPVVGIFVAFLAVIALGWGAGYTAAKTTGAAAGQGTGRGAGTRTRRARARWSTGVRSGPGVFRRC